MKSTTDALNPSEPMAPATAETNGSTATKGDQESLRKDVALLLEAIECLESEFGGFPDEEARGALARVEAALGLSPGT